MFPMPSLRSRVVPAVLAVALAGVAACGGDKSTTEPPPPPPPAGSISVAVSAPSLTVAPGGSQTTTVTITRLDSFTGAVSLALDGAPTGVTASFDPASVPGSATTSTLTVTTAASVAPGTYQTSVRARGQGVADRTATLSVVVAQSQSPALSLALNAAALSVAQAGSGTVGLTISRSGGFTGSVTLAAGGAPAGVTASFDPNPIPEGGSASTLTLAVGGSVAAGTHQLTVTAQGQGVADQSATLSLTVTAAPATGFQGTLTLARGVASTVYDPEEVVDVDLASGAVVLRFNGIEPHRTSTGETAFLARLEPGFVADRGVVVADAQGVTGAPLFVCVDFSALSNRICHNPRLSPNKQLVAFGTVADGGSVCKTSFDLFWADYVVVRDRSGNEVARFEGYYYPDWLPDGRLLMLGSPCRNAGVWITDASFGTPTRVDGGQVGTPAANPAVSPDGSGVIFAWNGQLWMLAVDGQAQLTQLTAFPYSVASATWSPDGTAFAALLYDVNLPLQAVLLFRPGDAQATVVNLPFYPYGPISWH